MGRPAENIPERILRAGLDTLRRGEGLGIRALAREARVNHQSIYNHFKDLQAIKEALVAEGFQRLASEMGEACSGKSVPKERIAALGEAYLRFARDNRSLFLLMFSEEVPWASSAVIEARVKAQRVLGEVIGSARKRGSRSTTADDAAILSWAWIHGVAMLAMGQQPYFSGGEGREKAIIEQITNALMGFIG